MTTVFDLTAFDAPSQTMTATSIGEVLNVLEFAERHAKDGAYVVVMISYEAAPAFDSALTVHKTHDFPLAWAAVYSRPANLRDFHLDVLASSWSPSITKHEYNESVAR